MKLLSDVLLVQTVKQCLSYLSVSLSKFVHLNAVSKKIIIKAGSQLSL